MHHRVIRARPGLAICLGAGRRAGGRHRPCPGGHGPPRPVPWPGGFKSGGLWPIPVRPMSFSNPPQGLRNRCPRYKAAVHEVEAAGPRVGSGSAGASRKAFCAIKGVSPSRPATGVSRTPTAMCPAPWPRCFLCACLLQAVGLSLSGRRVSGHHKAPERRDAARSRRGPMRFAFRYRQNPFWGPAFVEREL